MPFPTEPEEESGPVCLEEGCGGALIFRGVPKYPDPLLGIPNVVLFDAVIERYCECCGVVADTIIPNLPGLIAAVAISRSKIPVRFDARDIKFMRQALDKSTKEFALHLSVRPETVSRWESGSEPIGATSEKLLRVIVGALLKKDAPLIEFKPEEIATMDIQPLHPAGEMPILQFRLVQIPVRRGLRRQENWQPLLAAA